jgi:hypothetical protein
VNSNREEFSSNRQIFGAEQGLLCFSSRLERLGCRRRHSPAFQPHDPVDSPDQLSDGARKIDFDGQTQSSLSRDLATGKVALYM